MIEDNFRKVVPYVPGEQPKDNDVIKLNTNENPYPPSPSVLDALAKVDNNSFRKYPERMALSRSSKSEYKLLPTIIILRKKMFL